MKGWLLPLIMPLLHNELRDFSSLQRTDKDSKKQKNPILHSQYLFFNFSHGY
jgi:hypothetical protein